MAFEIREGFMDAAAPEARDGTQFPLAVDLDRTLIRTDSLVEQFLTVFCRLPWRAAKTLLKLREGKAKFKEAVIELSTFDPDVLLFNEDLLEYLHAERERGRPLHLVTAADQRLADIVAERVGIFESASGSCQGHNLKGKNKLNHLEERFPDGFSYAGDDVSDLVIWRKAKSAVLVGVSNSTRKAVKAMDCAVELDIPRQKAGLRAWARLLRIHQWSKNILIFIPLILGQAIFDPRALLPVLLGFLAMGLAASGTYTINDIADIASDRAHRTKRRRPIASGAIDAGHALMVAMALILAGVALIGTLSLSAGGLLLLYLAGTLSYSFKFKREPMIDIFILGSLYTIRIVIGAVLAGMTFSHWLLMFSFFFFFSLSMAKRHVEIVNAASGSDRVLPIKGRGYITSDAPLTLCTGVGTNLVAILILSLYVAQDIYPQNLYDNPEWLWGIVVMVMMWSLRIWFLSHRGVLDDDPVSFALRDRTSLIMGAVVVGLFALSVI
jgi:4-hydroxybenzoate polyprenyltransferase